MNMPRDGTLQHIAFCQSLRQFSSYDLGDKDFRMCESNKSEHVCWGAACENRNRPLIHRKSSDDVPVVAKCQKFHQSNSAGAASFLFTYIAWLWSILLLDLHLDQNDMQKTNYTASR